MALSGLRVIDLSDERGIYGAKLLADLGAEVLRPEPPGGDPLRQRGPFLGNGNQANTVSLWHAFFASNRIGSEVDPSDAEQVTHLQDLLVKADIVLTCPGAFATDLLDMQKAQAANPGLIVVDLASFSANGPWRDYLAPDIVAGALGGAAATTGDVDTPPLKNFGELNFMVSGIYAAIAGLSALFHRRATGQGQTATLSVHECLASCLEHVFMFYFYEQTLARPEGRVVPRRGALHWSDAYNVVNGLDGSIMITAAPDFDAQLMWLIEEDVHEDLIDPKYMQPEFLRERTLRSMDIMERWVANKEVEALFHEAQSRHSPYGWVLPLEKVAENPQLEARTWYQNYSIGDRTVLSPGAPYHFSETPWQLKPYQIKSDNIAKVAEQLSWDAAASQGSSDSAADLHPQADSAPAPGKPLAGLKVLDFTHVLAGPFATRMLADMGANVIKINSADRAVGTQDPHHPYYIMWNRNKRALALNMTLDSSRRVARELADQADIVIDNFSVGVLDRWGLGYSAVSQSNPKVIYVQMSGMGDGGPWSKYVTYAPTIHALCGLTATTSIPGRGDIGIGFSYNDHQAGLHGALAVLAALEARHKTGRGQRVDVSQFEVGVSFIGPSLLDFFANGSKARPVGNDLPYDQQAPHGCFRCKDEPRDTGADAATAAIVNQRWIAIACMDDAQWQALCRLMGEPAWATSAQLADAQGRYAAREELNQRISAWTADQDAFALMDACQAAGVPAGVVQDGADLVERDQHLAQRDFLQEMDDPHPTLGPTWIDRLPIEFSATPCDDYFRVRAVGEDSAEVLTDWLGMTAEQIAALVADGTIH